MAAASSLVVKFDDIIASSNILCGGIEGEFAQFVGQQIEWKTRLHKATHELTSLKSLNEANEVKLRHARSSFDYQLKKRLEAEESLKQYEKRFTIILELVGDNKLNTLTESERRSLAFLKETKKHKASFSPGHSYLSESAASSCLSPSDVSVSCDDMDVSVLRDGKKWKRRRTASVEKVDSNSSPPVKRKRSNDGTTTSDPPQEDESTAATLSLGVEMNKIPPLDKQFKKPPPLKNRRTPSKQHIREMAKVSEAEEIHEDVLPLPLPTCGEVVTDLDEMMPIPSAPPLYSATPLCSVPPLYPTLPTEEEDEEGSPFKLCVVSPSGGSLGNSPHSSPSLLYRSHSDFNMLRAHTFITKTMIKLETITCDVCNKKIKFSFSKNLYKCKDCRTVCHPECKGNAPLPCIPSVPTPKKKQQEGYLASYCPHSIPRVPGLVVHCINEIERRGLSTVGLYRVPGSDKVIKEVKGRLLCGKGNPGLDKVTDINVVCGVLKFFLRNLREPLLTFHMHDAFTRAAECDNNEDGLGATLEAIAQLPPANKDTLAFVILHLQRVAARCEANKMSLPSLAKVFGPTIVGHASPNPETAVIWQDTQKQPKVMEKLLGISAEYWRQYLSPSDNPDPPVSPSPSVQSSPGALNSPATPELRPVPESPFLGSLHSPRGRTIKNTHKSRFIQTPVSTRTQKTGNFFAPLN